MYVATTDVKLYEIQFGFFEIHRDGNFAKTIILNIIYILTMYFIILLAVACDFVPVNYYDSNILY